MFTRILKQSFHRQRRRKSLAALAVVAGMAVTTAMLALRVNLGDDLNAELRHIGANIVVNPASDSLPVTLDGVDLRPAGSGALLNEADLGRIKTIFWTNNLVAFAPVLDVPAHIHGSSVTVEGTYFDHTVAVPGDDRPVSSGMEALASNWSVSGGWPSDNSDEVLIGARLAQHLGLRPNGTILLESGQNRAREARIVGIVTSGGAEDDAVVAPLALAQSLAGEPGKYRQLLVSAVTKPEDTFARRDPAAMSAADQERWMCSPYARTIATQLQQALPGSSASVVRPVAESEGAILSQLRLLLWFITLLALGASALAICAAMSAAVIERRGEIALMKAVGAQDRAVGLLFFSEAALVAVAGGGVGFLVGEGLASTMATRLLGHPLAWKPVLAPVVLLLALGVALLGSWSPLRRAMRVEPATALRSDA